jgi:hypothetical protein
VQPEQQLVQLMAHHLLPAAAKPAALLQAQQQPQQSPNLLSCCVRYRPQTAARQALLLLRVAVGCWETPLLTLQLDCLLVR